MRRLLYVLFLVVLLISCSVDHETERSFSAISELLENNSTDSALQLLDSMKEKKAEMPEKYQMRYELLRVEALNKAFSPLDSLTVMDTVLTYYESHGSRTDKMMANYMMGCVHRDRGNSPVALEFYRKATEYADTTEIAEVRTLSRIYAQIADLFNRQRTPQLDMKARREAVRLALKAKDTIAAINYYAYLAGSYHMMGKMDSALMINQTGANTYIKMGRKDLAAGVLPLSIDIYLRQSRFDEAKQAMNLFEQESGMFKGDDISQGHELYYFYKGQYYDGIGKRDSALYYYRKLLQYPQIENLQAAYEGLTKTYKEIGMADSATKYAILYTEANDSVSLKSSSQEIVKMQALYDYNENQRIAAEKEKETERLRYLLYTIVIVVCFVAYLVSRYFLWQRRKKFREIAKANAKYAEILSQYNKSLAELESLKGGFETYQTEKQKEIESLKQVLSVYQSDNTSPEKWNIEQALLDSHIVHHLHQSASKAQGATSAEWNDLRDVVSEHLPDFYQRITAHKDLTDKEILVCILSKLRFIPSEMVILLGLTSQRITNIRSRINMKLFHEKGAQGLEANLRRF